MKKNLVPFDLFLFQDESDDNLKKNLILLKITVFPNTKKEVRELTLHIIQCTLLYR